MEQGTNLTPQEQIRRVVEDIVSAAPDGDITYFAVLKEVYSESVSVEMITAALRKLQLEGNIVEHRREKVDRPEAKDRKIIHYRATEQFKVALGMGSNNPGPATVIDGMSAISELEAIHAFATASGFMTTLDELVNFFLCIRAKPFVILSGISGTGKSQLPRIFGEAIGATVELVPVKPNWSDNSDLLGYVNVLHGNFVPGRLLRIVERAFLSPERLHFVILDEMNLAHVEHYLSDILSVMESRRRDAEGEVRTEPLPIDVPEPPSQGENASATQNGRWTNVAARGLPWNLFFVGTVNVDETTHPFSRKVLDRAYAIDFADVDLTRFPQANTAVAGSVESASILFNRRPLSVREVYLQAPEFFDEVASELTEINALLREADLQFAYRVRDEIALYLWSWRDLGLSTLLSRDDAFDFCVLQKILSRCQGSSEPARRALEGLFKHASVQVPAVGVQPTEAEASSAPKDQSQAKQTQEESPSPQSFSEPIDPRQIVEPDGDSRWRYPRTARKAIRMLRRYVDTGYFAFWS